MSKSTYGSNKINPLTKRTFINLFAGCGGLSLGLMAAGWKGLFAIEKDVYAFETLSKNLINRGNMSPVAGFNWPEWLPVAPREVKSFLDRYEKQIRGLRGTVTLIAGGPPCQGFSFAGRRNKSDPRNKMFLHYLEIVAMVRPAFILLENVEGISVGFGKTKSAQENKKGLGRPLKPFSQRIRESLNSLNYEVHTSLVRAVHYGVPQLRPRYIVIGVDKNLTRSDLALNPFELLESMRADFLTRKGLPKDRPVNAKDAISDLETRRKLLIECVDSPGFNQIMYGGPRTNYQKLLHGNLNGVPPNSLRLANHREKTRKRFLKMFETCRPGVVFSPNERKRIGMGKKLSTVVMDPKQPSHTVTTLPDDIIHYSEPRILTVRECARLQSFPDWFEFRGKYTTGGDRRTRECPRYTQVGNAVPPFLAEALGTLVDKLARHLDGKRRQLMAKRHGNG